MRMWMLQPKKICDMHLRAEHGEIHKAIGSINHGNTASVEGLAKRGYFSVSAVYDRHQLIEDYMDYDSELPDFDLFDIAQEHRRVEIDLDRSKHDLAERCADCCELIAYHEESWRWS